MAIEKLNGGENTVRLAVWPNKFGAINMPQWRNGAWPLTDSVSAWTNINYGAANRIRVVETLADETQNHVQPQTVNVVVAEVFLKCNHPSAAVFVCVVLPHGPDAIFEYGIVVASTDLRRWLDVIEQTPEVLHRVEGGDLVLAGLP